jgi:hypothetical protein
MSQFCTRCGKPLPPGVRFCTSCGGAVVAPATPSQSSSTTPAAQFTPVTPPQAAASGSQSASGSNDSWATVATPEMLEPAQPSAFAPVDVPAAAQPPARAGRKSLQQPHPRQMVTPVSLRYSKDPDSRVPSLPFPLPLRLQPPRPTSSGRSPRLPQLQISNGPNPRRVGFHHPRRSMLLASRRNAGPFCQS